MAQSNQAESTGDNGREVEAHRKGFRLLLAANPNYFDTFPDIGIGPVFPLKGDTTYESLSCVAYSPERDRLEATLELRRPSGYSGGLCTPGSYEYVRFFVSYDEGATFADAGLAAVNVHDLLVEPDCRDKPSHPLSYTVGVDYTPHRNFCGLPVLPLVRAILSWEQVPEPGNPDFPVVWGNRLDCHVQIRPRRFFLPDIIPELPKDIVKKLPPLVVHEVPDPTPDPGPFTELTLSELAREYRQLKVPEHRFALPHLLASAGSPVLTASSMTGPAVIAKDLGIDLGKIIGALEETSGDVTYEELRCVGLDGNAGQLVASLRVKQSNGYSGGPCTKGSVEYVAFWADFGTDCTYSYLGTAQVSTHDYEEIPRGGLRYAAILPVDLADFREECEIPVYGRIRAVLSWGTPPSTTDPDALPVWGNRVDTHVQLAPGPVYDGNARFTIVGGVEAAKVNATTGVTDPGGHLNSGPVPDGCPFAGQVNLHGPSDPALAGFSYRISVRNVTLGTPFVPLTESFVKVDAGGFATIVTPAPDGQLPWPTWADNTLGQLGRFTPGGNDLWQLQLELIGIGVVETRNVLMDNLVRGVVDPADPLNAGDLHLDTGGACRVPRGTLTGRFVARDEHFLGWGISVHGGPSSTVPPTPLTVSISPTTQTGLAGELFSLDTSALDACGYVVRLTVTDRAIVNSVSLGHGVTIERGVCLE
ncbi:hypothetical protein [Streptomyces sp. NPDC051183]|uniref:hypothetical protein n=1 Tax=unclassified Streptomyces TaxID=2593676 RepID=UPI00343AC337